MDTLDLATPSPSRARWRVPAMAAIAVATILAVIWALAARGGEPPILRLQGAAAGGERVAAADDGAVASDAPAATRPAGSGGGFVLNGELPDGPDTGTVHRLTGASEDDVRRLAEALGLGPVTRDGDTWVASNDTHQLTVTVGNGSSWWYGFKPVDCVDQPDGAELCAPDVYVDPMPGDVDSGGGEDSAAGTRPADGEAAPAPVDGPVDVEGFVCDDPAACTGPVDDGEMGVSMVGAPEAGEGEMVITGGDEPVSSVPAYEEPVFADEETVRRAAAPIVAAAGVNLDDAVVRVEWGTLWVDPTVDGLRTVGLNTSVTVDEAGTVTWANGWLGGVEGADDYPLISAQEAFDALGAQMVLPMIACDEGPEPRPMDPDLVGGDAVAGTEMVAPCGPVEPIEVTGVEFGYSVQWVDEGSTILVPSWLFMTEGNEAYPMAQIAVEPKFLGLPDPADLRGEPEPAVDPALVDPATGGGSGGSVGTDAGR